MAVPDGLVAADFDCGTLTVPQTWDDPEGDTLSIEVAVLRARRSPAKPDPFVFFGGGPGTWNLEGYLSAQAATVLAPIAETRDVVFFDQRGNGLSSPSLFCPEVDEAFIQAYTVHADAEADGDAYVPGYRQCHDRLTGEGIDLSVFQGHEIAGDVAALMDALGYETYNLYGLSYGGRHVQVMMRDRPENVRSAVLDSTVMPELSFGAGLAENFERSLGVLFDACANSTACATEHPSLRSTLLDVVVELNATPHVSPVTLEDGTTVDIYVTGDRFVLGLQSALYQADLIGLLPTVIDNTAAGDYALVDAFAPQLIATSGFDWGLYASMLCTEELAFETPESLLAATEGLEPAFAEPLFHMNGGYFPEMCEVWNVEPRPDIESAPVVSDIPTLVLSGNFDPATPPSNGEKAAANLSNSQYFLFNGLGHGVLRSDASDAEPSCSARIVTSFLDAPDTAVDGACAAELPGPFD